MNGLTKQSPCVITAQLNAQRMLVDLDGERSDSINVVFHENDNTWHVHYSTTFELPIWSGNDDIDSCDSMDFESVYSWNQMQCRLMDYNKYNKIAMDDPMEFIDNCINIGWTDDMFNSLTKRSILNVYEQLSDYALVHYKEDNVDPAYLDLCVQLSRYRD